MTNVWRPSCGRIPRYTRRPSYGRRLSYYGPSLIQQRKGRDPGRARQRRKKHRTRMRRRTAMRGQQRPERRSTEPTRMRSEMTTSLMRTRVLMRAEEA